MAPPSCAGKSSTGLVNGIDSPAEAIGSVMGHKLRGREHRDLLGGIPTIILSAGGRNVKRCPAAAALSTGFASVYNSAGGPPEPTGRRSPRQPLAENWEG